MESDSIQPDLWKEVIQMMTLAADRLTALGTTVTLANLGVISGTCLIPAFKTASH